MEQEAFRRETFNKKMSPSLPTPLTMESIQLGLREKAKEWLKDRPELIPIFEEFIKTPKEIDLTRKFERKQHDQLILNDRANTGRIEQLNNLERRKDSDQYKIIGNGDQRKENEIAVQEENTKESEKTDPKPKIKKVTKKKKKTKNTKNKDIPLNSSTTLSTNPTNPTPEISNHSNNSPNKHSKHEKKQRKEGEKRKHKDDRQQSKKFKPMEPREPPVKDFCKFFLHGNCYKGDSCPFSHDKKGFPCKFFHLYNSCKNGENCEFSHQTPLSDAYKQLLMNTEKKITEPPKDSTSASDEQKIANPVPFPQVEIVQPPSFLPFPGAPFI